jgi:hypothetical protein
MRWIMFHCETLIASPALQVLIRANVHILLVCHQEPASSPADAFTGLEDAAKKHLELMIEKARSSGVNVNYHIAYGNFEA